MELLLALAIVALVAYLVSAPLRRRAQAPDEDPAEAELADLEARKEARYREIRDAEADHAAGKLSDEDFRRLDAELRRDAIEILKRIDRLRGPAEDAPASERAGPRGARERPLD
jgi:flagellar biosynthesis/type III secretory pathway M-ring protein FliF/YscJ